METVQKAIAKALSMKGPDLLRDKKALCAMLDDMIPEQATVRRFIRMIYDDEIGNLLCEAAQATYNGREECFRRLDLYLQNCSGLHEQKRDEFLALFRPAVKRKIAEVKRFRDYRSALAALKQEYGENPDRDILQYFTEENRLFSRFSLTVDDVMRDLEHL